MFSPIDDTTKCYLNFPSIIACRSYFFLTGCKLQTAREVYNKKRNEAQGGAVNVIIKRQYKAKKLLASLNNRRVKIKKKKKKFLCMYISSLNNSDTIVMYLCELVSCYYFWFSDGETHAQIRRRLRRLVISFIGWPLFLHLFDQNSRRFVEHKARYWLQKLLENFFFSSAYMRQYFVWLRGVKELTPNKLFMSMSVYMMSWCGRIKKNNYYWMCIKWK